MKWIFPNASTLATHGSHSFSAQWVCIAYICFYRTHCLCAIWYVSYRLTIFSVYTTNQRRVSTFCRLAKWIVSCLRERFNALGALCSLALCVCEWFRTRTECMMRTTLWRCQNARSPMLGNKSNYIIYNKLKYGQTIFFFFLSISFSRNQIT